MQFSQNFNDFLVIIIRIITGNLNVRQYKEMTSNGVWNDHKPWEIVEM
jgi:hypothetical protein